ncbi:hypothetical protein D3C87_1654990 [compost metagenome]
MLLAKETVTTSDDKRNDDTIPALHLGHRTPGVFDDAHEFMAENVAVFDCGNLAAIQVQIGTANCSGRDTQNNVVGLLDDRIRNGFNPDLVGAVISHCSHVVTPRLT